MKVAIVHDWLVGGGAERVVEQLHELYPEAPIYTSYATKEWRDKLDDKVVTGWLQGFGKVRKFIPVLRIWWFTHLDLSDYDLVISSSGSGEARGVKVPETTLHISYCHSPVHFYWRHYEQYLKSPGFGFFNPLARLGLRLLVRPLRKWDHKAAQRADYIIANSTHIQSDIKKYYGRDSVVIHPPVDIERFNVNSSKPRLGFVTAGRQVPYKKTELIIEACNQLKLPLTVVGYGPEHKRLKRAAGPTITMLGRASDAEMPKYFVEAEGFIMASFEDFGVTPVEAMAAGTPVIAFEAGGALDYIKPNINGVFFSVQSVSALCAAVQKFETKKFSEPIVRESAEPFSEQAFQANFKKFIAGILK